MKEKVERLAKGNFAYAEPELLVSEDSLNISVTAGETFCGNFSVYNRDLSVMKGVLYSSCEIFTLEDKQFIGAENEIRYTVHAEFAKAGENFRGEVTIISECGEIRLPFEIHITQACCLSSEGEIRDMFQFAGLSQSDWNEAKAVFTSSQFETTVLADRVEEQTLYRQLMQSPDRDRAMEEFLVYVKKKSPVQIKADRTTLSFAPKDKAMMDRIIIWKDNWGYTDITVETKGDFFLVSAKEITSEQFAAGRYALEVAVDGSCLAPGDYFGQILLKTARQVIRIDVSCIVEKSGRENEHKRHLFHETEAKLYRRYFDFRLGKIKAGNYIAEAESIVELLLVRLLEGIFPEMQTKRRMVFYRLYRAYLAIIGGKAKLADGEMESLSMERDRGHLDDEMAGALYYLDAMRQKRPEQVKVFADKIRALSDRHKESKLLFWFRIYTERRTEGTRLIYMHEMKKRFAEGQCSPLLYFEAALLWNEDPALIEELSGFEKQVLLFALEKKMLKKETVLQIALLAMQTKHQDALLLRCLCTAYEQFSQRDLLQAICSLLIARGNKEEKYHRYFSEACAAQIKLAGLQEYYIYTCGCNFSAQLEQAVLLYFIYGNELEEPYRAFFYAYVVKNKDNMRSFYRTYLKRIEQYAVSCIREGRIDKNLAVVYNEVIRTVPLDSELATVLPDLLFTYCVETQSEEMVAVCVSHKEEDEEQVVMFENKTAYVRLYTEDAQVVLLDAKGNRYLPIGDCRITRLLHEEELLNACYEPAGENRGLLLNLLEKVHNFRNVNVDAVELSKRVVRLSGLRERFRQEEIRSLVRHCYDTFQAELLDTYLAKLNPDYLNKEERCQSIELLIVRGRYDLALDAIVKYGTDGISPKRILRLCERMLLQCGGEANDMLLILCHRVFLNRQHNSNIVEYLIAYFNGTTEEMYRIWNAAKEYSLDTTPLEERLLGQILFTGNFLPDAHAVFLSYRAHKGNPRLLKAYVSYAAYRYFVKESSLADNLLEALREFAYTDNPICRLALLKYLSEQETIDGEEKEFAERCMGQMTEDGILFPFFKNFEGKAQVPPCMEAKLYVEYRTAPDRQVRITYLYDNGEEDTFKTDEMKHMGYGIYVKEFILFYGEVLQYYISENQEGGCNITESFYRDVEPGINDETTKYGQINLILTALDLQDEKTSIDMLENYYRMEFMVNRLFTPIKE